MGMPNEERKTITDTIKEKIAVADEMSFPHSRSRSSSEQYALEIEGSIPNIVEPPIERFVQDKRTGDVRRQIRLRTNSIRESKVGNAAIVSSEEDLRAIGDKLLLTRSKRRARTSGKPVSVVDLFCGCGGMSLGIREACDALGMRFESRGALDFNEVPLRVFAKNFRQSAIDPSDLGDVLESKWDADITEDEQSLITELYRPDFLVAGPPCQGHSNLNNATRRDDPRNELYLRVARAAFLFEPRFVLIENVMMVTKDRGRIVPRTREALEKIGYRTSEAVADLWDLGVAQSRRRHVLFGQRQERSCPDAVLVAKDVLQRHKVRPRDLEWAIGDLVGRNATDHMNRPSQASAITQARINYLFENSVFELPDTERPDCHRLKRHSYGSVYGRMHWDRPAPTITGGFDTMGRGRFVHPSERRTITPREAARIQGFPDYFDFSPAEGNRRELIEMIGNAVPPKLSYVFALECLR